MEAVTDRATFAGWPDSSNLDSLDVASDGHTQLDVRIVLFFISPQFITASAIYP